MVYKSKPFHVYSTSSSFPTPSRKWIDTCNLNKMEESCSRSPLQTKYKAQRSWVTFPKSHIMVYSPGKTWVWGSWRSLPNHTLALYHFLSPWTPRKWGLRRASPPPLPQPGGSACGHSRLSAHWEPAAAGRPCCLSALWSAEQTSPSLQRAEGRKDSFNHILQVMDIHTTSHTVGSTHTHCPPGLPRVTLHSSQPRPAAQKSISTHSNLCSNLLFPALSLCPHQLALWHR